MDSRTRFKVDLDTRHDMYSPWLTLGEQRNVTICDQAVA